MLESITITDPWTLSILTMGALVYRESLQGPADYLHHLIDSKAKDLYKELPDSVFRPERAVTDVAAFCAAIEAGRDGMEFTEELPRRTN